MAASENNVDTIRYIDRKTGALLKEIVPGEQWLQWLYHNPLGQLALHAVVKRKFLSQWYGKYMDSAGSCDKIADFVQCLNIDTAEAARPMEEYASFNDFFTRELKPGSRPVDTTPDSIVSPADGKVLAFEGVDNLDAFFVKGQSFSVDKFLRNLEMGEKYDGGTLIITRLAPVDYHRFHFPASGHISPSRLINGFYSSVSPYSVKGRIKTYWENKREYSMLKTSNAGDIVLAEVGATMVGSIVQNYEPYTDVTKGQEKGWFKFGGSTVVMLLEPGKVAVDSDILANTRNGFETTIRMGEKIATALG